MWSNWEQRYTSKEFKATGAEVYEFNKDLMELLLVDVRSIHNKVPYVGTFGGGGQEVCRHIITGCI